MNILMCACICCKTNVLDINKMLLTLLTVVAINVINSTIIINSQMITTRHNN